VEIVARIMFFLATGIVLLVVNAWYLSIVYHSIKGGGLVIAPIRIVGAPAGTSGMDESLARMLLVRLRSITADLEQSQTSLKSDQGSTEAGAGQAAGVSTLFAAPRTVRLEAQLFEPTDFDVKVAGVEVGALLPWFQRWFVEDRTLSFTVSLQEHTAFVAGNIDALGGSGARPIWIRVENQSPEAIVDGIAFSLIQRAWAKDEREIGDLKPEEFRTLVLSVGRIAEINRRVRTLRVPARAEFAAVLNEVGPLADRIAAWSKLTYFAATIAEGAQDNQRAVALYQRLKEGGTSPLDSTVLEAKLKVLGAALVNAGDRSLGEYRQQAAFAATQLDGLFGFTLTPPPIELLEADYRNAYWDGTAIHVPPGIEDIPDVVVHEAAWPFIQKLWDFQWEGQSGALANSYADVLTSIVKQARLNQTAEQADWTIAPGGIAWITGRTRQGGQNQWPLRSLKAPGTAYDDAEIGKDPQVAHYRDLVITAQDQGGIHTNSGIPNKAFYEAAVKIGTENAGRIWVEALKDFKGDVDMPRASRVIKDAAARLYGANSREADAVAAAWKSVGL
jgi:hypothetical protein